MEIKKLLTVKKIEVEKGFVTIQLGNEKEAGMPDHDQDFSMFYVQAPLDWRNGINVEDKMEVICRLIPSASIAGPSPRPSPPQSHS